MNCSIKGCSGQYEPTTVLHTAQRGDRIVVIEHVPAEVCSVCGDVLFHPDTVKRILKILEAGEPVTRTVPVVEFAGGSSK